MPCAAQWYTFSTFYCWQCSYTRLHIISCAVFSSHWGHYSSLYRQTSLRVQVLWHKMENGQHFATLRPMISACGRICLDAANMLYSLENEAASFGPKINTGKTKSMIIANSSTIRQPRPNAIVLNGHPVEEVNQLCIYVAKYARMVAATLPQEG